ncbi:hypothetical protein LUTEI9C_80015 [Luteimonas sp. 9C]|nr:hypothetical protein LUTEI9C_80015 [Luteimonas sp. 9C]
MLMPSRRPAAPLDASCTPSMGFAARYPSYGGPQVGCPDMSARGTRLAGCGGRSRHDRKKRRKPDL